MTDTERIRRRRDRASVISRLVRALPVPIVVERLEARCLLTTIVVTSTADTGAGTLRNAITTAISDGGATINFNISGSGAHVISPASAFPYISVPITIDGTTQPGYSTTTGKPLIQIDGSSIPSNAGAVDGLDIDGGNSTIKGLDITRFSQFGINIGSLGGDVISNDYLGVDPTGTIAEGNSYSGIGIYSPSANDQILKCVISANGTTSNSGPGVQIYGSSASGTEVENNYIGTDLTGTVALGNAGDGVNISGGAAGTTVSGNVIDSNANDGVNVFGTGTNNTSITSNKIGTDSTGAKALGNVNAGIGISQGATGTSVTSNVLSANGTGIFLDGSGTSKNTVSNNMIGTDSTGTKALGNIGDGVVGSNGASNNTVSSNVISANGIASNYSGVYFYGTGTTDNLITGNKIGTDTTGTKPLGNGGVGVLFDTGAASNTLSSNVISDNGSIAGYAGIDIEGTGTNDNVVQGNEIGTDITGSVAMGNSGVGVFILDGAQGNLIGTNGDGVNDSAERNIISNNAYQGVGIQGSGTNDNVVAGDFIGTDGTGTKPMGNQNNGVWILDGAEDNRIGTNGTDADVAGEANVIDSNVFSGVAITDSGTSGNIVAGNFIGTDLTGKDALGNALNGVQISDGATDNQIGGGTAGGPASLGNTITNNTDQGVDIYDGTASAGSTIGNTVRFNDISSNGILDLDLGNDGISPHLLDVSGPNDLINYPTITTATPGSTTAVSGTYLGVASHTIALDFYSDTAPSLVGFGGGQHYLGSLTINTDSNGNATFSGTLSGATTSSQWITATATDTSTGDTSEFSLARQLPATATNAAPPIVDLMVLYTPAALSAAGSVNALQTMINESLDLANRSLNLSDIDMTIRLVDTSEVNYTESGTLLGDLNNLSAPGSPDFPTLLSLRAEYGVDDVCLIANEPSAQEGGDGYEPYSTGGPGNGYCVVGEDALGPTNLTMAHELGHTLGAGHERGNANPTGLYSFSHGYRFTGSNGVTYHDIMSYDPGIVLMRYSNPNIDYDGVPLGIADPSPDSADLASTFYYTGHLDASFYPTEVADTTPPKATLFQTTDNNGTITAVIRFTDDESLNTSTITSNALSVTAAGVTVPVQLLGVDQQSNGSIRFATFQLTPAPGTSISSLQYSIVANQVSDLAGNFMPAQQLSGPTTDTTGWDYANADNAGNVAPGVSAIISGDNLSLSDTYQITVTATSTLTLNLNGYTGVQDLYLEQDTNNNGQFDSGEALQSSTSSGSSQTITTSVTPGVYYIEVGSTTPSPFTLSLSVPPGTQAATTTTLTKNTTAPIKYGQSVTFTATAAPVSPATGTPTGTVTFIDNGTTVLGNGTLSGGVATLATTTIPAGSNSIKAVYNGDPNFTTSESGSVTQTVSQAATTTTLTKNTTTSITYGQSVTFTATIAVVSPGAGTPTGIVTFEDGSTVLGTGTVNSGVATLTTTTIPAGSNSIKAVYGGDTNFTTSTSGSLSQTVHQAATTTTLTKSTTTVITYGQSVTFTAKLAIVSPGAGTPTGTVTFEDGSTVLGTGTVSGGIATLITTTIPAGSNSIKAIYGGDNNFTTSTSNSLSQTVHQASTTTKLTKNTTGPIKYGQAVSFTATIVPVSPGAGTPTGTVTFMDGSTVLGTATLSGGVATFMTTTLPVGSNSITAVYGGDPNFTASTSGSVSQTVDQASTTNKLTKNTTAPITFGQSVTFTATLSVVSPGGGTPAGTITFMDNGGSIGTATLSDGVALLTTTTLPVGSNSIMAVYGGNTDYGTSTSNALSQTVD